MLLISAIVVLIALYTYALAAASMRWVPDTDHESGDLFFVLLVPALNEEKVIGDTLASLLGLDGDFLILIIDDASEDGTVDAAVPYMADPRLRLLKRPTELARRGKGDALNAGLAEVRLLGLAERYGPQLVIVTVFDSDARVDPLFIEAVSPYFHDPKVAGVQSAVRMYNAHQGLLTLWQSLEFAVWNRIFCRAKNRLQSATLGGNGQCVRLSALNGLGTEPWLPSSLTEDLDLSLRLLANGWRLRFCPSVAVWQEAVPRLRPLVRQRSRWLQGHIVCWRYIPALLHSPLPILTRLDLVLFLLLPLVILPIGITTLVFWARLLLDPAWGLMNLLAWYILGFGMVPLIVAAWRQIDDPPLWRALLHGHLFILYFFVWFAAGVAVYWKVVLGRRGWTKTSHQTRRPTPATETRSQEVPHE